MSTQAMASPRFRSPPGRIQTILLAGTIPLFLVALLSDIAYYNTYQIQWTNFASWLIVAGLVFCGFALLCALVDLVRARPRKGRPMWLVILLLATFALGLLNAIEHAKDAWATMPSSLVLSVIVFLLSCASAWLGLAPRAGGAA